MHKCCALEVWGGHWFKIKSTVHMKRQTDWGGEHTCSVISWKKAPNSHYVTHTCVKSPLQDSAAEGHQLILKLFKWQCVPASGTILELCQLVINAPIGWVVVRLFRKHKAVRLRREVPGSDSEVRIDLLRKSCSQDPRLTWVEVIF